MRILVVLSIILVWLFALVNWSGWGFLLHSTEKMNWLFLIWAFYWFFVRRRSFIPKMNPGMIMFFLLLMVFVPFFISGKWHGALYLVSFLTIYCFSNINITDKELIVSSLAIGIMGAGLISIYQSTDILSGWNDNTIAMLTLFSYIYFTIFFNSAKGKFTRFLCFIVSLIYYVMISKTASRGATLFMIISIVLMLTRNYSKGVLSKSYIRFFILQAPLVIALATLWVSAQSWFPAWDTAYQMKHIKPFFNGRDELWKEALGYLSNYPLGTGRFVMNYHNSAVACISVFGVLGYLIWVNFFQRQLTTMSKYMADYTVYACLCAFLIIFVQQATELGFISENPNVVPYMILGLGLGRVRWYEERRTLKG